MCPAMAQTLQCLVCITIIVTSATSARKQAINIKQRRYLHLENRIAKTVNRSIWSPETRSQKKENKIAEGVQITQNGMTLNQLQVNKTGALKGKYDKIEYPVQTSEVFANYRLIIPDDCKEKGFCEDVPNYPNKRMEKVIARLGNAVKYFNWEPLVKEHVLDTDNDEKKLCASIEKTVYLQSAPDSNDTWHAVINPKDHPVQRYRVEMCRYESSKCFTWSEIPSGYEASCAQKHVLRMVEVLINDVVTQVPLKLPSCCSCVIKVTAPVL